MPRHGRIPAELPRGDPGLFAPSRPAWTSPPAWPCTSFPATTRPGDHAPAFRLQATLRLRRPAAAASTATPGCIHELARTSSSSMSRSPTRTAKSSPKSRSSPSSACAASPIFRNSKRSRLRADAVGRRLRRASHRHSDAGGPRGLPAPPEKPPADMVFVSPDEPRAGHSHARKRRDRPIPSPPAAMTSSWCSTQLWQRLLGLDQVDAKTDFFDSGGHSLLAVRLFTEIRKRFNIDFGLSTLFEARTIGALAELIRKAREAEPSQKTGRPTPSSPSAPAAGTDTPLFLIHDVGGSVLRYEHLARHFPGDQADLRHRIARPERPARRLQRRGNGAPLHRAKSANASRKAPILWPGTVSVDWSTYEIARQLSAQGEHDGPRRPPRYVSAQSHRGRRAAADRARASPANCPSSSASPRTSSRSFSERDRIGYLQERKPTVQAWLIKTTLPHRATNGPPASAAKMPAFLHDVKEANWIAVRLLHARHLRRRRRPFPMPEPPRHRPARLLAHLAAPGQRRGRRFSTFPAIKFHADASPASPSSPGKS